MAELGTVASIVGILAFGGQVIQGCQNLRGLIDGVKDAPADVKYLKSLLDLVESNVFRVCQLMSDAREAQVDLDVSPDIQFCREAVESLAVHIRPALASFSETEDDKAENPNRQLGRNYKRGWYRLRVAFDTPKTKELVSKLERAKVQLLSAQASITHLLQLKQTNLSFTLKESADTIQRSTQDFAAGIGKTHNTAQETLNLVIQSEKSNKALLLETRTTSREMMTVGQTTYASINALQSHFSETAQETATVVQKMRADLHDAFGSDSLSKMIDGAVQKALLTHFTHDSFKSIATDGYSRTPGVSSNVKALHVPEACAQFFEQETSILQTRPSHQKVCSCQRKKRLRTSTTYNAWLCTIRVETSTPSTNYKRTTLSYCDVHDQNDAVVSHPGSTTIDIRFSPRLIRHSLLIDFPISSQQYRTGFDMQLRTYRVVSSCASVFDAVDKNDISTLQRLFETGEASPFDVDSSGASLLDKALLTSFPHSVHLFRFLLNCGSQWDNTDLIGDEAIFWLPRVLEDAENGAELMRLFVSAFNHDPFENHDKLLWIGKNHLNLATTRVLIEQDQWEVTPAKYQLVESEGIIHENERLMVLDPECLQIRDSLLKGKPYTLILNYQTYSGFDLFAGMSPLHDIFVACVLNDQNEIMRKACLNRLALLLECGYDPQQWHTFCFPFDGQGMFRFSGQPSTLARLTDNIQLWLDALELAGWTPDEISDLWDDELYVGVPILFTGIDYSTTKQNCEEFVEALSTGYFLHFKYDDIRLMSKEMEANISFDYYHGLNPGEVEDVIGASKNAFKQWSTPGFWIEDSEIRLKPGLDFELPSGWELWWERWHDDA